MLLLITFTSFIVPGIYSVEIIFSEMSSKVALGRKLGPVNHLELLSNYLKVVHLVALSAMVMLGGMYCH